MGGEFLEVVPPERLVFTALAGMQEGWSQSLEKLALIVGA